MKRKDNERKYLIMTSYDVIKNLSTNHNLLNSLKEIKVTKNLKKQSASSTFGQPKKRWERERGEVPPLKLP